MDRPKSALRSEASRASAAGLPARVRLWTGIAQGLLVLERALAGLAPAACVAAAFMALALFDLFAILPLWLHWLALGGFAAAFAAALWWGLRRWRWPSHAEALHRLEADSGLSHRPLTHLEDRQASNLVDPWAAVLWAQHRKRLLAGLDQLNLAPPRSDLARRDPLALRGLVLILLALGLFLAWDQTDERLMAAALPQPRVAGDLESVVVEAWITPPDYTRLAPIALKSDGTLPAAGEAAAIDVPIGSKLLVQIQGLGGEAALTANDATAPLKALDAGTQRAEATLTQGDRIALSGGGLDISWPISLRPDLAPSAALEEPEVTERAALRLVYTGTDDFGVADLRLVVTQGQESLELPLTVQGADPRQVKGTAFQDLTAHPWAGLPVELRAVARDALGQIGASAPVAMTLPERKFYHPVARAIIEQRKKLAQSAGNARPVARSLRQLQLQPDAFDGDIVTFMALDFAARRLSGAEPPAKEDLAEVQQLMWDTALALEDGGVSMAMRELRRLQRELEEALARGASEEEIERLMNELQQAMNEYLRQMQEQLQQAMQRGAPMGQINPDSLTLSQQDLNEMLNQARRMAQSGSRDSAQQMLQQLQNMLENLQMGMPMPGPGNGEAQQMLNDLGRMMNQQQQLLQDTFRMQRGQQPGEQPGEGQGEGSGPGQNGPYGAGAQAQDALRQQLGDLMRRFSNMTGNLPQGMGQAEQSMRGAVQSLQGQDLEGAAQSQNDALEQMQQSLQQMSQQLQQMSGSRGPGQRDPMDPFGRDYSDQEDSGDGPAATDNMNILNGANDIERSRQIFEELRERRNDPNRPKLERDYLDRLLRQF